MSVPSHKSTTNGQSLFWILAALIIALSIDYGVRAVVLWNQRGQLHQAQANQTKNISQLNQAGDMEMKLRALSIGLVELGKTNADAKKIVQEFGIQWTPPASTNSTTTP